MQIATHNAEFHADETFGFAVLAMLFPDALFLRTRNPSAAQLICEHSKGGNCGTAVS